MHIMQRIIGTFLLAVLPAIVACSPAATVSNAVSLEDARSAHESGQAILIDIREPNEHAQGVAPGAQLLPMRQLSTRLAEISTDPTKPVLLICKTQNRSSATLKLLQEKGYTNIKFVQGGMSEWAQRGWPLVKPSDSIIR